MAMSPPTIPPPIAVVMRTSLWSVIFSLMSQPLSGKEVAFLERSESTELNLLEQLFVMSLPFQFAYLTRKLFLF